MIIDGAFSELSYAPSMILYRACWFVYTLVSHQEKTRRQKETIIHINTKCKNKIYVVTIINWFHL